MRKQLKQYTVDVSVKIKPKYYKTWWILSLQTNKQQTCRDHRQVSTCSHLNSLLSSLIRCITSCIDFCRCFSIGWGSASCARILKRGRDETGILTNLVINGQTAQERYSCPGCSFWVEEQNTQQPLIYFFYREQLYSHILTHTVYEKWVKKQFPQSFEGNIYSHRKPCAH